jgi:single-strand DNA-binding protein
MSYNRIILVGRLTKDPECRYIQSGKAVCSMRLAVDRGKDQPADFINIVAWEKLAETCVNNLAKGKQVLIEGRLQIRQYEKDGQKREAAEVVANQIRFLERKGDSGEKAAEAAKEILEGGDLADLNLNDL